MKNIIAKIYQIICAMLFNSKDIKISYSRIKRKILPSEGYTDYKQLEKRYFAENINNRSKDVAINDQLREFIYCLKEANISHNNGRLLDIGCGDGIYSTLTTQKKSPLHNMTYVGVEKSNIIVERLKSKYPKHIFYRADAKKLPFNNSTYDIVIASGMLQYTLNSWKKTIKEISRVAKHNIIVSRLPLSKYHNNFYVRQDIKSNTGNEIQYFVVPNKSEFLTFCQELNLHVDCIEPSGEIYTIKGVNEPIFTYGVCLRK